jgi:hypothetical protein
LKEKKDIIKESKLPPLEKQTKHMAIDKVEELYKGAPEEQKSELEKIIKKKRSAKKKQQNWSKADEKKFEEVMAMFN